MDSRQNKTSHVSRGDLLGPMLISLLPSLAAHLSRRLTGGQQPGVQFPGTAVSRRNPALHLHLKG